MRGKDEARGSLFSYVDLEQRIRPDHPLRVIRGMVNAALTEMSTEFDALHPRSGRDSIPPERLRRALLLQAFYSIRSERQLVDRIDGGRGEFAFGAVQGGLDCHFGPDDIHFTHHRRDPLPSRR